MPYFIKIHPAGSELCNNRQRDGQTNLMKSTVAFQIFAKTPITDTAHYSVHQSSLRSKVEVCHTLFSDKKHTTVPGCETKNKVSINEHLDLILKVLD
jgi:hypothetical protein